MTAVLRITLTYEGDTLRVEDVRRVRMVPLPADPPPEQPRPRTGAWWELQDPTGRTLYRRRLAEPGLSGSIEVPSGDPDRPFARYEMADAAGSFDLLLPIERDAADLVILKAEQSDVSSVPDAKGERPVGIAPARELLRERLPTAENAT